jgi:LuxR family maltose regulon positive regulatory protein
MLAQGKYNAALSLSEHMLNMAVSAKRMGRVIEVLILQALIFQGKKDMNQALAVIARAMTLAQPERYTRVFLDEGESMMRLLYQAKLRQPGSHYPSDLLSMTEGATGLELPSVQLLSEPLTQRELEVLKCIEAGYSNQDIADRLVISNPTVKRHISNLFAKLGAKNRTQAVSLGRDLRLFE